MKIPSIEELECLNGWPASTVGHDLEELLINQLHELCTAYGCPKVRQFMRGIKDMWQYPHKIAEYRQIKENLHPIITEASEDPNAREQYG